MNDKYVVFKREDWDRIKPMDKLNSAVLGSMEEAYALPDAEVIRRQDIFAAPGLYAYANVIQTGIELMTMEGEAGLETVATMEYLTRLEEIRDYFWTAAQEAEDLGYKKIPD